MPNHDRFECQTAIDSDAILHLVRDYVLSLAARLPVVEVSRA